MPDRGGIMGKVIVRTGKLVAADSAASTPVGVGVGARRGLARTRTANIMLVAAALAAGLTVTACQPTNAPASQGGGQGGAAPAAQGGGQPVAAPAGQGGQGGQAGEDPGCA